MYALRICTAIAILVMGITTNADIYDPMNVFCGSSNCYEILGVNRTATSNDIRRAYRRLSLIQHPDKNKEDNATANFRVISKAYEVLEKNESRSLFDYYLDHPRAYFKVSGHHYMRALPKSNVFIILFGIAGLVSWFLHVVQYQRWERAMKAIKTATLQNLSLKNGGSKQTQALHNRAATLYDAYIKEAKASGVKNTGKSKMQKDPKFEEFVDQVVSEVKVEGGFKKPELRDMFIVHCFLLPKTLYSWAAKYHRRYISTLPLSEDEQLAMTIEYFGLGTWEESDSKEKQKLLALQVWTREGRHRLGEMEEKERKKMLAIKQQETTTRAGTAPRRKAEAEEEDDSDFKVVQGLSRTAKKLVDKKKSE